MAVRLRLLHIHRCRGITRRTMHRFLKYDETLSSIYHLAPTQLKNLFFMTLPKAQQFYQDLHCDQVKLQLKHDLSNYSTITIVDDRYPSMLKQIKDPPLVLYAAGDKSLFMSQPILSVIGSRLPTKEAWAKVRTVLEPLIKENWVITSGMARGIDSYAHKLTLLHHGKTIAVLGSGFHHIYPKENHQLFEQIKNQGLVLSEYPPSVPPRRHHFPERNRIISGLSFGTLVIEAKERSGTLITVDQALDQGREVYAVPGSIFASETKGCHMMIQDGAKLVIQSNDISDDWELRRNHFMNNEF